MLTALAGLTAGLLHVLSGPDHLAAVAPLATETDRAPWRAGLQWGLGHTAGVVLVGALLVAFRDLLPLEAISAWSERIVGLALIGVGLWGLRRAQGIASGRPHSHGPATTGASFGMGLLHGLAGSSHLFGVLPALALPTRAGALAYLGGFGAGAVVAMSAFAAVVGRLAGPAGPAAAARHRALLLTCSAAAIAVGLWWLVG